MASMTVAQLAKEEDHNQRRYFERGGWRYFVRSYPVAVGIDVVMPRPGAFFPGESDGPCVVPDHGMNAGPSRSKTEGVTITIVAAEPILNASDDTETYTYGT